MGLETGTYVSDLNPAWPLGTDLESQGDDHIRLIKAVLKATFPGQNAPLTPAFFLPIGVVMPFAGMVVPTGWLLCFGQEVSRTTYSALFAAIGTTWGTGDGSTTFNLPDICGRFVAGPDNMGGTAKNRLTGAQNGGLNANAPGKVGGEQGHVTTLAETMPHTHYFASVTGTENQNHNHGYNYYISGAPAGAIGQGPNYSNVIQSGTTGAENQAHNHNFSGTTDNGGGGGAAHNNVPPAIAMNYVIFAGA
jgi:microcystin-dependent protein